MTDVSAKADRCKRLLEDPDLKQAFADTRTALLRSFEECSTADVEKMSEIKRHLLSLKAVEQNLMLAIENGQLEDFRANEQERPILGDLKDLWTRRKQRTG